MVVADSMAFVDALLREYSWNAIGPAIMSYSREITVLEKYELLKTLSFGRSVAEHEQAELQRYFVQTHLWSRVRTGDIDIILGEKGCGKSAIFLLLQADQLALAVSKSIYLIAAENPRGDAAFANLVDDPPADEREIELVWRVYFIVLVTKFLESRKSDSPAFIELYRILVNAGLMSSKAGSLIDLLKSVRLFVRKIRKVGIKLSIDQLTWAPEVTPEIELESDFVRINEVTSQISLLFMKAEQALASAGLHVWILIDRLDIAFEQSAALEKNALRALLRTYSSLNAYEHINLKIFLRSDLFDRITDGGFREASHIEPKSTELAWDEDDILDVIIQRVISNTKLVSELKLNTDAVKKNFGAKEALFYRVFPKEVQEVPTLKWILQNLTDGRGRYCPRDVIEFMTKLKNLQINAIEKGFSAPIGDMLFNEALFEAAYDEVSAQKCKTILYAEYPDERRYIDALRNTKYEFPLAALAHLWGQNQEEAAVTAQRLIRIGFFVSKHNLKFGNLTVSSLYRPALDLSPGAYSR